jgi:hypothetical protein
MAEGNPRGGWEDGHYWQAITVQSREITGKSRLRFRAKWPRDTGGAG